MRATVATCVLALSFVSASCSPKIDVKKDLQITDLTGGWFDAGIVDGKNKLVPSVTFRIRATTDQPVRSLALNVAFKKIVGETEEEWDEVFLQSVEFGDGDQTAPLTVRTSNGYTGEPPQTRADMLKHSQFQDMRAVIFGKYGATNWVEMARFDLPRQLLTK
jgi:hypothetical protein